MLELVNQSERPGKQLDPNLLSISSSQTLRTRLFSTLLQLFRKTVPANVVLRVWGLIGWCAAPKTGHLPFLSGIYLSCTACGDLWLQIFHCSGIVSAAQNFILQLDVRRR